MHNSYGRFTALTVQSPRSVGQIFLQVTGASSVPDLQSGSQFPAAMAPQSLYISNLAVSFSTKVQDAYCQLSLGGSSVRTSILGTNSSRQVHM